MRSLRVSRGTASALLGLAVLLAVGAFPMSAPLDAQGLRLGVKGGPTGADLTDLDASEARSGFAAGAYAQIGLSRQLFLQPELLYVSRRLDAEFAGTPVGLQTDFADLGALLGYRLIPGPLSPFVYGGPVLGLETRCRVEIDPDPSTTDCPDLSFDTKSTQTFLALGGGLDISLGLLVLTGDLRYYLGLSDAAEGEAGQWRSWAFLVGAGIGIGG